jgi:diguanylate cyclase (GGDEF)-like protein
VDAKGNTHICVSPLADDASGGDAAEPCPSYLIVVDGGLPGTMFQLREAGLSVGRNAENTIQLTEVTVSRRHAQFSVDINGHVGLTDLDSSNGTYLNGQRLSPHSPVWVRNGDRVRIGASIVLKYMRLDPRDEKFQRELFERMVRDSLTGLFNRGYFLQQLEPLDGRSREAGLALAVLFIDVDHFKKVNDSYGHDAGDLVLKEVAHLLRESARPDDLVARYGGEEFVVAIPVASTDLARDRAERIRRAIANRPIRVRNRELRVTASLGVGYGRSCGTRNPQSLITMADDALYQAKRHGRNRVFFQHADRVDDSIIAPAQVMTRSEFDLSGWIR